MLQAFCKIIIWFAWYKYIFRNCLESHSPVSVPFRSSETSNQSQRTIFQYGKTLTRVLKVDLLILRIPLQKNAPKFSVDKYLHLGDNWCVSDFNLYKVLLLLSVFLYTTLVWFERIFQKIKEQFLMYLETNVTL